MVVHQEMQRLTKQPTSRLIRKDNSTPNDHQDSFGQQCEYLTIEFLRQLLQFRSQQFFLYIHAAVFLAIFCATQSRASQRNEKYCLAITVYDFITISF